MTSAVIVAGGTSLRYGAKDKLEEVFFEKTVLKHSVDAFYGLVDEIIVVGDYDIDGVKCVKGGDTRCESVLKGLQAVNPECFIVAIHDGARPFVSRELIFNLIKAATVNDSAVPVVKVTDTLWANENEPRPLCRDEIYAAQTPQCFNFKLLKEAFARSELRDYTDESTLFKSVYGNVCFSRGETTNRKITYYGDVPRYRVGAGFDVHAFGEGSCVKLGGIEIPFNKKLLGHSDADVVCHALCDAVLSASGQKDIGHLFPDTNPKYAGADSAKLLDDCVNRASRLGYDLVNVSAVIICEQPKIAPYLNAMTERLAEIMKIAPTCVGISATTTEKLGALGRGDGIACEARAILKKCGM